MTKKLVEKNTCLSCKKVEYRDAEVIDARTKYGSSNKPLSAVIVKKYTCECGEDKNLELELIKEEIHNEMVI